MNSTFDRYVIHEFLKLIAISLGAFIIIYLLVDILDNIDTYIDRQAPVRSVFLYYVYLCPYIIVLTLPIAMLLASMLSVGGLARNNELVAMKASGVSLYRILSPLWIVGLILSFLVGFIGGWVYPETNVRKDRIEREEIKRKRSREGEPKRNLVYQDEWGRIYHVSYLRPDKGTAEGIRIISGEEGTVDWRIDARRGVFNSDLWNLTDGVLRVFRGDREVVAPFRMIRSENFNVSPTDLLGKPRDPEELGVQELRRLIKRMSRSGLSTAKQEVELNLRFSFPLANFLMVLLGAPLASNPRRSGLALSFGLSIAISFVFFGSIRACQALGHHETLHPAVAAWIPDIVFFVAGSWILTKVRK